MSSSSASSPAASSAARGLNRNAVLFLLLAVVSLLLAEQVATGWLAFGDRLNISRRDFNLTEIVVIVGGVIWAALAAWTSLSLFRPRPSDSMHDYFNEGGRRSPAITFVTVVMAVIGVGCILIAIQIYTGWIPLTDRVNISRRDMNPVEWIAIVLATFWGLLNLRTVLGFVRREQPAWSWAQWALFLTAVAGVVYLMSGLFDIPRSLPKGGTVLDAMPRVLELIFPGVLITLTCWLGYSLVTQEYGGPRVGKSIAGSLAARARSRDISAVQVPAGQMIRNRLSRSPGAGAIIGFVALFTFFTVATDLFLDPQSLASALTNNVTRGIVAIGTTMLMISGEFDLSVGSLLGISGLTFLGLMTGQFPPGGPRLDPITAAVLTLAFVGFLGALNGWLLIRTGIPSFIVTLATQLMLRGIPLVFIAGGANLRYVDYFDEPPYIQVSRLVLIALAVILFLVIGVIGGSVVRNRWKDLRERFTNYAASQSDFRALGRLFSGIFFGITAVIVGVLLLLLVGVAIEEIGQLSQGSSSLQISFFDLMNGRITSLPIIGTISREINLRMGVFWWLVLVVVFQFILNQTRYGNATFAVGGNAGAARAQGINVNRIKVSNYIVLALLVATAGMFDAARLQSIDALRGQGLELQVIAATVIGGALLTGGYGSIIGALLGVFIFGMMQTGLVLIGVDARLFDALIGVIILGAVIINTWSRRVKG
jgi:ribose/xylose/arabinose/galactoside ABC-type transport system permease subunit